MATAKAVKSKGLKGLIGTQVMVKGRYTDVSEGPFKFLDYDPPYLQFELEGKAFWWHTDVIEGIRQYEEVAPIEPE
jgi:hypothetical protein